MRKFLAVCFALSTLFLLSSCTSYLRRISSSTSTSYTSEYKRFNGEETLTIRSKEALELRISIESDDGQLSVLLIDQDDNICYEQENVQAGDVTIPIKQNEKYKLKLTGDDHSGKISADWSMAE